MLSEHNPRAMLLGRDCRVLQFQNTPVSATLNIMIALLNGLMRQRSLGLEKIEGLKEETIAFRRRSLVRKEPWVIINS